MKDLIKLRIVAVKALDRQMRYLNHYIASRSREGLPVGLAQDQYNTLVRAFLDLIADPVEVVS